MSERTPSQLVSPFHLVAEEMLAKGYHPIPLEYAQKYPAGLISVGWPKYGLTAPTPEQLNEWLEYFDCANVGIAMGSSVIAVDIDCKGDEPLAQKLLKLLRPTPAARVGEKGACYLYRPDPEIDPCDYKSENRSWGEMKAFGTQIVIPPSVHPDTNKEYFWINGFCDASELPILSLGEWIAIKNLCNKWWEQETGKSSDKKHSGINSLQYANAQISSHDGAYFRHVYLRDMAYALACNGYDTDHIASELLLTSAGEISRIKGDYFQNDEQLKGRKPEAAAKAMANKAIKAATEKGTRLDRTKIIKLNIEIPEPAKPARNDGIYYERTALRTAKTDDQRMVSTIKLVNIWKHPEATEILERLIPPGGVIEHICNEFRNEMNQSAILPFSAALSLCGAMGTNRIVTRNRGSLLAPNCYLMTIAGSGKGKTHSKHLVEKFLMDNGPNGIALKGAGKVLSTNALPTNLGKRFMRRRLDSYDEMDSFWSNVVKPSSATAGFDSVMNELYSSSTSTYGTEIAKNDNLTVEAIVNPGLNICGFTTPSMIKRRLQTHLFTSGCLSRFIVFIDPVERPRFSSKSFIDAQQVVPQPKMQIPEAFKSEFDDGAPTKVFTFKRPDYSKITEASAARFILNPAPEIDQGTQRYELDEIIPNMEAIVLWATFREALEEFVYIEDRDSDVSMVEEDRRAIMDAMVNRTDEMILKLCMIYCVSQNTETIDVSTMLWAIEVYKVHMSCYLTLYEDCYKVHGSSISGPKSQREVEISKIVDAKNDVLRAYERAIQKGDRFVNTGEIYTKKNLFPVFGSSKKFEEMIMEMVENGEFQEGWTFGKLVTGKRGNPPKGLILEMSTD